MANNNFPCKNCKNRTMGCHSLCEKYKMAKVNYNKEKEHEKCLRNVDNYIIESYIKMGNNYKKNNFRKNYVND